MSAAARGGAAGPLTHHELFAGLRDAGARYLVTGATALVLHGVPRLTIDVDLVPDPDPDNLARLRGRLAGWGYGPGPAEGQADPVERWRHGTAALDAVDLVPVEPGEFARLAAAAVPARLVDVEIPVVAPADLRAAKERSGRPADLDDAVGIALLGRIAAGDRIEESDARADQILRFRRWSVPYRCDWLLAAARLRKGLSPEAKPGSRGPARRRPWADGARRGSG